MRHLQTLATESIPRDGEATPSVMRPRPCMDVPADAQDMQPARSTASAAGKRPAGVVEKTGWPMPELMQDDCRPLFRWFASKPDSRHLVRLAAAVIVSRSGDSRIAPVLAVDFYRGAK